MARALLVGCGERGRALGRVLAGDGWVVRGTTRSQERIEEIEADGIEAAVADPERPGTILDLVGDVTAVFWLLGSVSGDPAVVEAIHGPRLQGLLERLVDTPVRGFVYEGAGSVDPALLLAGAAAVEEAGETWSIPVRVTETSPYEDPEVWLGEMQWAAAGLIS